MRALSEDRRRLWTATWKPKASHVWTNSAVFTDFTVFPPKYQEDSQLKTGWRQELGEMRAMNSRRPLLTFITSCGKTAEALGDVFHLLNKGFCPVRFHIHPLQFCFFFPALIQIPWIPRGTIFPRLMLHPDVQCLLDLQFGETLLHSPEALMVCIAELHTSRLWKRYRDKSYILEFVLKAT